MLLDNYFKVGWSIRGWFGWMGGKPKMGDLILMRETDSGITTMGEMSFGGNHLAYTLEPPHNNPKEPKCIPACRAKIEMQWSTRFQRDTPHLLNVPGRSLIEIHPLNDEHLVLMPDGSQHWTTEGCIGVGETKEKDWVGSSVLCLTNIIIPLIEEQIKMGDFYIQIIDPVITI
jgi:hypothetical protein